MTAFRSPRSKAPRNTERQVLTSSAVFVNIPGIRSWPNNLAHRAMSSLHQTTRSVLRGHTDDKVAVLSALTGAVILVPDQSSFYIHKHLTTLGRLWTSIGLPVRAGVVHGDVELLADVDGLANVVGEPINIAARLAYKSDSPGCILHDSYLSFISGLADGSIPKAGRRVSILGKSHDVEPMRGLLASKRFFPTVSKLRSRRLPRLTRPPRTVNAVAIAYDLPRFSAGDRSELSKRFRAVVDAFSALKANGQLGATSSLYFSPGGDGGVIVVGTDKRRGYQAAESLAAILTVESLGRDARIDVASRIGLHYGPVSLYRNAAGILRPTGRVCFIADALASDQKMIDQRSLVLSGVFRDAAADGSREFFERAFQELPILRSGPAKGIKRFVKRQQSEVTPVDPLVTRFLSARSSWERAE